MAIKRVGENTLAYVLQKIKNALLLKVDKVEGKGLSTNDYTTEEKTKLAGLSNYTLPAATASTLGGIKIGAGLSMNGDILSATGGGVADSVAWENIVGKPDFTTVYKPCGTVAFASLPTLSSSIEGNVYNISNSFTTTSNFVEGTGHTYPAGSNVVCISVSGSYKWDVLSGIVDLSAYTPTSENIELTNVEVDSVWNTVFGE